MFVHHVYFWFKDPNNKSDLTHFEKELKNLVKVPTIKSSHLGKPAQTPRDVVDNTYTYSLLVFFETKEDHDTYQVHDLHNVFIQNCSQYWDRVQVYDSVDI